MVPCGTGTKVVLSQLPQPPATRISNRNIPRSETTLSPAKSTRTSFLIATKPYISKSGFSCANLLVADVPNIQEKETADPSYRLVRVADEFGMTNRARKGDAGEVPRLRSE